MWRSPTAFKFFIWIQKRNLGKKQGVSAISSLKNGHSRLLLPSTKIKGAGMIGYARVSTNEQENYLQLDALKAAGVTRVFQEKGSSVGERPQLRLALAALGSGCVLIVYKLDRVARSLRDLLGILDSIHAAGAGFRSLTEPIDTTSPVGVFILQILGAVGQFERSLIRERAIAGQVAAYTRGVRWGGQPRAVSVEDAREIYRLRETGLFTIPLLAEIFDCSESTVWRSIWISSRPDAAKLRRLPVLGAYVGI